MMHFKCLFCHRVDQSVTYFEKIHNKIKNDANETVYLVKLVSFFPRVTFFLWNRQVAGQWIGKIRFSCAACRNFILFWVFATMLKVHCYWLIELLCSYSFESLRLASIYGNMQLCDRRNAQNACRIFLTLLLLLLF